MRQFIFILCFSSIVKVLSAQIEMSKFAVDFGIGTQEFNAIGFSLGTTYFHNDKVELYGNVGSSGLGFASGVRPISNIVLAGGVRYKVAERRKFSTHLGLSTSFNSYNYQGVTQNEENTGYSTNINLPIMMRYQYTDYISLEYELALGYRFNNSLGNKLSAGHSIGLKYRFGKKK